MKRTKIAEKDSSFWALADLLRGDALPGWQPASIRFEFDRGVVTGGGTRWRVTCSVEAPEDRLRAVMRAVKGGEPLDEGGYTLNLAIHPEEFELPRAAAKRLQMLEFIEAVQAKVKRIGLEGNMTLWSIGPTSGHFSKAVRDLPTLRREMAKVAKLRL